MKLTRESIKLGTEYNGKWAFCIRGNDADDIERVEEILCEMETGYSVGGVAKTWGDNCDHCPLYDEGFGSGFLIAVEDVPAFKEAWKAAKKSTK